MTRRPGVVNVMRIILLVAILFSSLAVPFEVDAASLTGTRIGSEYIFPATDYGAVCEFNIKHGLEMYAPGGSRNFDPKERVYYNLQLGDLDSDSGFQDLFNPKTGLYTPGGCLCDLATHIYHSANMAGLLADYDKDGHEVTLGDIIGTPPKPWIIIWHVEDYDPAKPETKNANEKDFWIENQNSFSVTFNWEELPNGDIKIWWEKASGEVEDTPEEGVDITQACVFSNPFRDGKSLSEHQVKPYHGLSDGSIPGGDYVGEAFPTLSFSRLAKMGEEEAPLVYDPEFDPTSSTTSIRLEGVGACQGWVQEIFYLEFTDGLEKLQSEVINSGQSLGVAGQNGVLPQFDPHLHISIGHRDTPAPGLESYKGTLVDDMVGPVYWYDITSLVGKQYVPEKTGEITEEPIKTIADLPFVVDVRDTQPTAANLVGVSDLKNPPEGILWHQSATGPIDSTGQVIDGVRLCELEKNRGDTRCGYHVVVGVDEIKVDGETYAVAQWLIDTDSKAWHALEYNNAYLAISFIDEVKEGPPTPAQLRTMLEITNVWVAQFGIDPDEVMGHKEVHPSTRGDPIGVDMSEMRDKVETVAERVSSTGGTYYFMMPASEGGRLAEVTTESNNSFRLIDWSPQMTRSKMLMWYIYISAPIVLLLLMAFTEKNLNRLAEKKSKAAKFDRGLNKLNLLGLAVVSLGFIVMVLVYQPISYRPQVTYSVVDGNDQRPEEIPAEESVPDESIDSQPPSEEKSSSAAGAWSAIAAKAGYKNPGLLELFCTEYAYPRGPDGAYLSTEQGGKIFPCELAASIAKGETDTTEWVNPDPRQPGVWGHNLGWVNAPEYFPRTAQEILEGRAISKMAEACRNGLDAVANNAVVQAKYPGLTAQNMYTSMGCSIGRGQTLAIHFLPGEILGDLENMDVWGSDGPAIEAVYRHLVSKVSDVCGDQSWYYSGNAEVALCSYNPRSWGVAAHAWYWDAIRAQSVALREAIVEHADELVAAGDSPQVRVYEETKVEEDQASKAVVLSYSVPAETIGSGVYTIWDTIPSLMYRTVRGWSNNSYTDLVEQSLLTVAETFYSDETLVNLGFATERKIGGGD